MNTKYCFSKKLAFVILFVIVGFSLFLVISSYLNNQKFALNSRASTPNAPALRSCGTVGSSCCSENRCNNGLTCKNAICSLNTCGEDSGKCCGTVFSSNRCDETNVVCEFDIFDDQTCMGIPSDYKATKPICYTRLMDDSTPCGYENSHAIASAFAVRLHWGLDTNRKPYFYLFDGKILIRPVSREYIIDIDCNGDGVLEKFDRLDAQDDLATNYITNSGSIILRKRNSLLEYPFSCELTSIKNELKINTLVNTGGLTENDSFTLLLSPNELNKLYNMD